MRRKEERSKQSQTNNKAKQHSTPNEHVDGVFSLYYKGKKLLTIILTFELTHSENCASTRSKFK